ncbi:MAG: hypothetical protein IJT94_00575 [Oscillibacter sp.]|nr:hypothetical protein [Oscillibacter sp.]
MAETKQKSMKYFMRKQEPEIVTAPGPDTFRDEEGNVIPFEIRVLTQKEIQDINNGYRDHGIATNKRGEPLISNGEVVWKTDIDRARASRHMIAEALVYPNLKDPETMKFYNCHDISEMPLHVFQRPDEYAHVSRIVMQALGLMDSAEDEDDLEAAKN